MVNSAPGNLIALTALSLIINIIKKRQHFSGFRQNSVLIVLG